MVSVVVVVCLKLFISDDPNTVGKPPISIFPSLLFIIEILVKLFISFIFDKGTTVDISSLFNWFKLTFSLVCAIDLFWFKYLLKFSLFEILVTEATPILSKLVLVSVVVIFCWWKYLFISSVSIGCSFKFGDISSKLTFGTIFFDFTK